MRPSLLAALTVGLVFAWPRDSAADDPPRTVLEKAAKAMGGEEALARPLATHCTMRGKVPLGAIGKEEFAFSGEIFTQPNGDFKYSFDLDANQIGIRITMALVGEKGWRCVGDMLEDLDEPSLAEMKVGRYYDRIVSLAPVLKDKSFALESLAEVKVRDKPAVGVKVTSKGQPDISLFFDTTTFILVKTEYRAKTPGQDKEMLHECYYSDWREPDHTLADEQIVKAAKLKADAPALLDYLRKLRPAGGDVARIKQLVEQLGDDSFETRVQASKDLVAIGQAALPQLREAAEKGDTEVKQRAKQCLKAIGNQADDKTVAAAVRIVGWRKPEGAAEVLLDWAARSADDALGREVRSALAGIAVVDGKPVGPLVKALEEKDPARRAAAAAALGKEGGAAEQKPGRRLYITGLKFPMKAVQFQNGAKMLEREYVEIQFFNRLDDDLFTKRK